MVRPAAGLTGAGAATTAGVLGVLGVGAYVVVLMYGLTHWTYDTYGGLLTVPALLLISIPVLVRLGRRTPELGPQVLVLALLLKLASGAVRYVQSYVVAGGADAERYHDAGVEIAHALHSGLPWQASGPFPGTAFMEGLAGYVYWVTGTSRLGGYFVFSWLGFWGLLLFTRAFRTALPEGDSRRYALLVLFLPSLLFWPSSIGKDTWMTLMLGLAALGAARVYRHRPSGFVLLTLGITGAVLVRPHMAVLLFGGLFVGYLVRPLKPGAALAPLVKGAGVVILLVAGSLLVTQAEAFFADKGGSVNGSLEEAQRRTSQGGSEFEAQPVRSPADLPFAVVTVLFRPFPHEARSPESLVASAEGVGLLALLWLCRARVRGLPRLVRREPFVAFCVTYTLLFVVAFSSFGNFGILTRQRVQVFPFFLVLLALPLVTSGRAWPRGGPRFTQAPVLRPVA